jgi:hypothetical protein
MVTEPVRVPIAVGVNVTLIWQFALAATLVPQLLVWAKSPLTAMLLMFNAALPVLERVTVFAALAVGAASWRDWQPACRALPEPPEASPPSLDESISRSVDLTTGSSLLASDSRLLVTRH